MMEHFKLYYVSIPYFETLTQSFKFHMKYRLETKYLRIRYLRGIGRLPEGKFQVSESYQICVRLTCVGNLNSRRLCLS